MVTTAVHQECIGVFCRDCEHVVQLFIMPRQERHTCWPLIGRLTVRTLRQPHLALVYYQQPPPTGRTLGHSERCTHRASEEPCRSKTVA